MESWNQPELQTLPGCERHEVSHAQEDCVNRFSRGCNWDELWASGKQREERISLDRLDVLAGCSRCQGVQGDD